MPTRSLSARLVLIVLGVLLLAHGFMLGWMDTERRQQARNLMQSVVAPDVAGAVTLLEGLTPAERVVWLDRLARPGYRYHAGAVSAGAQSPSSDARWVQAALAAALGAVRVGPVMHPSGAGTAGPFCIGLMLADGTPYTLELDRELVLPGHPDVGPLALQLVLLAGLAWVGIWWAMRPLERLVRAAGECVPERASMCWPGGGTRETARIAQAFNRLGAHAAWQCTEQRRVFSAVARELARPFTRLRLRVALLEPDALRQSLFADLAEVEAGMGVGAMFVHATGCLPAGPVQVTDLHALLDALVCDYADEGHPVRLVDRHWACMSTRPGLLRRVLTHLIDGALHFPGEVELRMCRAAADGNIRISVLDRGPSVSELEFEIGWLLCRRIDAAAKPSQSAHRLGLLTARRLAAALGADLGLHNRPGGGLEVSLDFSSRATVLPGGVQDAQPPE